MVDWPQGFWAWGEQIIITGNIVEQSFSPQGQEQRRVEERVGGLNFSSKCTPPMTRSPPLSPTYKGFCHFPIAHWAEEQACNTWAFGEHLSKT
jgi:hypothetical protein